MIGSGAKPDQCHVRGFGRGGLACGVGVGSKMIKRRPATARLISLPPRFLTSRDLPRSPESRLPAPPLPSISAQISLREAVRAAVGPAEASGPLTPTRDGGPIVPRRPTDSPGSAGKLGISPRLTRNFRIGFRPLPPPPQPRFSWPGCFGSSSYADHDGISGTLGLSWQGWSGLGLSGLGSAVRAKASTPSPGPLSEMLYPSQRSATSRIFDLAAMSPNLQIGN